MQLPCFLPFSRQAPRCWIVQWLLVYVCCAVRRRGCCSALSARVHRDSVAPVSARSCCSGLCGRVGGGISSSRVRVGGPSSGRRQYCAIGRRGSAHAWKLRVLIFLCIPWLEFVAMCVCSVLCLSAGAYTPVPGRDIRDVYDYYCRCRAGVEVGVRGTEHVSIDCT